MGTFPKNGTEEERYQAKLASRADGSANVTVGNAGKPAPAIPADPTTEHYQAKMKAREAVAVEPPHALSKSELAAASHEQLTCPDCVKTTTNGRTFVSKPCLKHYVAAGYDAQTYESRFGAPSHEPPHAPHAPPAHVGTKAEEEAKAEAAAALKTATSFETAGVQKDAGGPSKGQRPR